MGIAATSHLLYAIENRKSKGLPFEEIAFSRKAELRNT
jgi:hypothetical protein